MSPTLLNEREIEEKIYGFVNKAKNLLDIDDKTLSEIFEVSPKEVENLLSGTTTMSAKQLFNVSTFFNTPIDRVLDNSVDFQLLRNCFKKINWELPEYYLVGANGKKRSVTNILDYLSREFGERELEIILKSFQLSSGHFQDPESLINNRFLVDLLNKLEEFGYTQKDFVKMGEASYEANKKSMLGECLASAKDKKELIEQFFSNYISFFDKNFHYKIQKLTNKEALIVLEQNEEVKEALRTNKLGSMNANIMKLGVLKSLPRYINQSDFQVTIPKTIHSGDSHCVYKVSYDNIPSLRLIH